jgi:hypothetical protein
MMGYDIGVFFCWGIAYPIEELDSFAEGDFRKLQSRIAPEAFKKIVEYWRTSEGETRRRNLVERLQLLHQLREDAQFSCDEGEAEDPGEDIASMLAESGCGDIGVYAIRRWRAYDTNAEPDCLIVGFRPFASVVLNPKRFDLDALLVRPHWMDEIRRFSEFEGLPFNDCDQTSAYSPGWLLYVEGSDSVEFELRYRDFSNLDE